MESIEKILANLKEGELTFVITVLINALLIYIICFYFVDDFKNYIWYQELLIPISISLSYTFLFVGSFFLVSSICLGFWEKGKELLYNAMQSHLVFYYTIFPLSVSLIVNLYKLIYNGDSSFSLEDYFNIALYIVIGSISSPALTLLFMLITKIIICIKNLIIHCFK